MDKTSSQEKKRAAAAVKAVAWSAARAAALASDRYNHDEGVQLALAYQALSASISEAVDEDRIFRIVFQEQEELPLVWEVDDDDLNED
jgi:hypothetical protein